MANYMISQYPQINYAKDMQLDFGDLKVAEAIEINEGISRVDFDNRTLIDLTYDNVTPNVVMNGYMFHGSDGNIYYGNYQPMVYNETYNEVGGYYTITIGPPTP